MKLDPTAVVREPEWDAARGVWRYLVSSQYQQGAHAVEVLLPAHFDRAKTYRVLYVLPVEPGVGGVYGDGLMEVKKADAHNRHQLICVTPAFGTSPWYGRHATNPEIRHEEYLKRVVVPLIEGRYPTPGDRSGRLLLGFSKSGWGAFTLILRDPDFFGTAASWDAPLMLKKEQFRTWEIPSHFGTPEQFAEYLPGKLLKAKPEPFRQETRLVLLGSRSFGQHTEAAHQLMETLKVQHRYRADVNSDHAWNSGWVPAAIEALVAITSSR